MRKLPFFLHEIFHGFLDVTLCKKDLFLKEKQIF